MRKFAISALSIASVLVVSSSSSHAFGGRMGFGAPMGFRAGGMAGPGFAGHMGVFNRPSIGGGFFNRPMMNVPTPSRGGWPCGYNQVANNTQPSPSIGGRGGVWNVGQQSSSGYNSRGGQNLTMNAAPPVLAMPQSQVRPMPTYQPSYPQPTQTVQPAQSSSGGTDFAQTVQSIGSTVTSVLGTVGAIAALF